jgi:tRNA-specific 2-thiouridylase
MVKALGLLSGGLDSILAIKVLQEQGIAVTGISFVTPFFNAENAKKAADELAIPLIEKQITKEHLTMLLKPKHGYGSNMNPCIDCHALMLKIAGGIMEDEGFDFLCTGEVLGERPMSQNKAALKIVARESGYQELILRPLSARLLPETKPEREGKVDRERLLDLSGRQRKRQFELAKHYRLKHLPTPASGCLLTDPGFSARLKDLIGKGGRPDVVDIELLKIGRHVALDKRYKMIIGRNEKDNTALRAVHHDRYLLFAPRGVRGPLCMIPHALDEDLMEKAMKMCASYCDAQEGTEVAFQTKQGTGERRIRAVSSRANRPKTFIGVA